MHWGLVAFSVASCPHLACCAYDCARGCSCGHGRDCGLAVYRWSCLPLHPCLVGRLRDRSRRLRTRSLNLRRTHRWTRRRLWVCGRCSILWKTSCLALRCPPRPLAIALICRSQCLRLAAGGSLVSWSGSAGLLAGCGLGFGHPWLVAPVLVVVGSLWTPWLVCVGGSLINGWILSASSGGLRVGLGRVGLLRFVQANEVEWVRCFTRTLQQFGEEPV